MYISGELDQVLQDFNAVYQSSWKATEQFSEVIEGIVNNMSKSGWLRLGVLYIAGQPAAAQIWFVVHGKASIFRLAYDEAWRHYSPGSILISHMMKHVIDVDKVEEIDFLTGNDAYKQEWMSERRERWGMQCGIPQQTAGKFKTMYSRLKDHLK
jgi:CelD/BcsL family acetyltransferase involved in cellulose biosynthesis